MGQDIITPYLLILGEDIIASCLFMLIGCIACIAGYLDMTSN